MHAGGAPPSSSTRFEHYLAALDALGVARLGASSISRSCAGWPTTRASCSSCSTRRASSARSAAAGGTTTLLAGARRRGPAGARLRHGRRRARRAAARARADARRARGSSTSGSRPTTPSTDCRGRARRDARCGAGASASSTRCATRRSRSSSRRLAARARASYSSVRARRARAVDVKSLATGSAPLSVDELTRRCAIIERQLDRPWSRSSARIDVRCRLRSAAVDHATTVTS